MRKLFREIEMSGGGGGGGSSKKVLKNCTYRAELFLSTSRLFVCRN
jgi:hypothetical protein